MPSCVILTYHVIDDPQSEIESPYCCPPDLFAAHMQYLARGGYVAMTLAKLLNCMEGIDPWPAKPVVITIDDGFGCSFRNGLPLLLEHRLTATVFVVADLIDKDNEWAIEAGFPRRPMLARSEIIDLNREGIEIGSHTRSHPRLGRTPIKNVIEEVRDSKLLLEDMLQKQVASFAYPYGSFNLAARDAVQASGYRGACSTIQGKNRPGTDPFLLRRVSVNARDTLPRFGQKLWLGMSPRNCMALARHTAARFGLVPPKSYA